MTGVVVEMGNFWHRISGPRQQMNPPRTIDELLSDICCHSKGGGANKAALDADAAIRSSYWANKFRTDFLERRNMHGKVASLRFLVVTQVFEEDCETANNNTKRGRNKSEDIRTLSLAHAHRLVLSESAEHHLPLSNGALFDLLRQAGERAERGVALDEETARAVRQARRDISVRKNGLDPKYAKFLSSVDVNSGVACLLSIL